MGEGKFFCQFQIKAWARAGAIAMCCCLDQRLTRNEWSALQVDTVFFEELGAVWGWGDRVMSCSTDLIPPPAARI